MSASQTVRFETFEDRQTLAQALANEVAGRLSDTTPCALAVAGGTTPPPFFTALKPQLKNKRVTVTLTDERWVSLDDEASNEKLVRRYLLDDATSFLSLKSSAKQVEEGAAEIESRLAALPLPFAAVVIGMGDDGHVAALFPHSAALAEGLNPKSARRCIAVTQAPKLPDQRISLTYACLTNSRAIYLHIIGEAKREALQRALASKDASEYPVCTFLQQTKAPLTVYWAP